jgi:hypothetical protein
MSYRHMLGLAAPPARPRDTLPDNYRSFRHAVPLSRLPVETLSLSVSQERKSFALSAPFTFSQQHTNNGIHRHILISVVN